MKMKKGLIVIILLLLLVGVTVGYSALSASLSINGTSKISDSSWDVHFSGVAVNDDSTATAVSEPEIASDDITINYEVNLVVPGDFYEFDVDVVNGGSIDAKLSAAPTLSGVSSAQDVYLNYTIKNSDGTDVEAGAILEPGESTTYTVRIEFDKSINNDQLPTTAQDLDLSVTMDWEQA